MAPKQQVVKLMTCRFVANNLFCLLVPLKIRLPGFNQSRLYSKSVAAQLICPAITLQSGLFI